MYRTTNALLLAALLSSACQSQTNPGTNPNDDGGGGGGGKDQGSAPTMLGELQVTTIRDLNSDRFPTQTHVQVTGVVQSPGAAAYAVQFDQGCLYELFVVQADPSPSLKDGIAVRYLQRNVATGDMMIRSADCQQLAAGLEIGKSPRGTQVEIQGILTVQNGIHSIDLGSLGRVKNQGRAQTQPQPVPVTAAMLPSGGVNSAPPGAAFVGAYGALVSFQNVITSDSHAVTQTFRVSAAAGDTNKTRVSTTYLRILDSNYAPPADGTTYKSVTGIVTIDSGGSILPRGGDDLVP